LGHLWRILLLQFEQEEGEIDPRSGSESGVRRFGE
jgi:hypothetical protein